MNIQFVLLVICSVLLRNIAIAQQIIPLYSDTIPNQFDSIEKDQPTLECFLPAKDKANGTAIIIFPGGAYTFLAYTEEGTDIAKSFVQKGFAAFVVKYRLPEAAKSNNSFVPIMDGQQAIKLVRSKAHDWNFDIKKIGVIGYSAGGHLASTLGTHFNTNYIPNKENISVRPDFMILVYPVISMQDQLTHVGSRVSLLGTQPTREKIDLYSNELQVTKDTPPTYLTHTGDDSIVDVNNSIVFYQALQKNGVDAELHLFPKGNHGFTQRLPVNEWMEPMLSFLKREGMLK